MDSLVENSKRLLAGEPLLQSKRLQVYLDLLRTGQASPRSLALAAGHGDPTARLLSALCDKPRKLENFKDIEDLAKLPVTDLAFQMSVFLDTEALKVLGSLPLRSLSLVSCIYVADEGLKQLANCPLNSLEIQGCPKVSSQVFEYFSGLELVDFSFQSRCSLISSRLSLLKRNALRRLNLEGCQSLNVEVFEILSDSAIEFLDLGTRFDFANGPELVRLPELKTLILDDTRLTRRDLSSFRECPLERLELGYADMHDDALQGLQGLPLTALNLQVCEGLTGRGLKFLRALPLRDIDISGLVKIEAEDLRALSEFPLQRFAAAGVEAITAESLSSFHNWELHELNLASCDNFSGWALAEMNLQYLRVLALQCCQLNDAHFENLGMTALENLYLGECRRLSCDFLQGLADSPLKILDLSYCESFFEGDFQALPRFSFNELYLEGLRIPKGGLSWLSGQQLDFLDLENSEFESGSEWQNLGKIRIKSLRLSDCKIQKQTALKALKPCRLELLDLNGCEAVDDRWRMLLTGDVLLEFLDSL